MKTKVLISCVVTTQLICAFVFTYAKSRFSTLFSQWHNTMELLYCLLVTAFLLLSQLLVISCAFIIILDAVDITLCIHTIISQENAIVECALNIMLDAVDILLCIDTVIS